MFESLLQKVQKKFVGWKCRLLSFSGKLILLKHVLNSMPIHLMSVLSLPDVNKRKWVSWRCICLLVEEGGLGIWDLLEVRKSLFMKFALKLLIGGSLWSYFFWKKICGGEAACLIWGWVKGILLLERNFTVREGILNFWYYNWLGDGPIVDLLPVVGNHNLLVQDLCARVGWKYDEDMLVWKHEVDGVFTTMSALQIICSRNNMCPWKKWLWQDHVPKKMSFLCWQARQNAIPVDATIQQLGIPVVSRCHCCVANKVETSDHVFCDGEGSRKASLASQVHWLRGIIPILISWALWKARCAARMEDTKFESKGIIRMVKGFILDISGFMKTFKVVGDHDLGVLRELNCPLIAWAAPIGGISKLNIDCASLGNPRIIGGGGGVRDAHG
ncbi:hypothetical protein I3760_15G152100 [Carya illinoinensis]|nr:hypothetical protein I3760_15G152100 [Carya illinoinensis]